MKSEDDYFGAVVLTPGHLTALTFWREMLQISVLRAELFTQVYDIALESMSLYPARLRAVAGLE